MDNDISRDFVQMLRTAAEESGKQLGKTIQDLEEFSQKRLEKLAAAVGQPGFDKAVEAETQNIQMEAALNLVANADAADSRILGIISGGLEMAAKFLSRALGTPA